MNDDGQTPPAAAPPAAAPPAAGPPAKRATARRAAAKAAAIAPTADASASNGAGVTTNSPAAAPQKAPARKTPARRSPARPPSKAPAPQAPAAEAVAEAVADAVAAPEPALVPDPVAPGPATEPKSATGSKSAAGAKSAAKPRTAVIAVPPAVRPKDPARLAVQRHLATHAAALLEQEPRVRADAHDSVHKMRVAARRLRSGLRTFRPLVDAEWARGFGDELRWLASSLGAMRDREVLLARLERDIAELPAWAAKDVTLATVRAELGRLMDAARGEALAALDSPRYANLVDALAEAAANPPTTPAAAKPCSKALPPLVAKSFRRLAEESAHLHLDPPQVRVTAESDDAWHEARITAKKARYAAEACEPVFGKPATLLVTQLSRVTELLGEHQDAAVAADAVVEIGQVPTIPPQAALTLGVLHGVQRDAVLAARAEFVAIWPEVAHKRWRAWL